MDQINQSNDLPLYHSQCWHYFLLTWLIALHILNMYNPFLAKGFIWSSQWSWIIHLQVSNSPSEFLSLFTSRKYEILPLPNDNSQVNFFFYIAASKISENTMKYKRYTKCIKLLHCICTSKFIIYMYNNVYIFLSGWQW